MRTRTRAPKHDLHARANSHMRTHAFVRMHPCLRKYAHRRARRAYTSTCVQIHKLARVQLSSSLHPEDCAALGASDREMHDGISHEVPCFRASNKLKVDRRMHTVAPSRPYMCMRMRTNLRERTQTCVRALMRASEHIRPSACAQTRM